MTTSPTLADGLARRVKRILPDSVKVRLKDLHYRLTSVGKPCFCPVCRSRVNGFLPLRPYYFENWAAHSFTHPAEQWETFNVEQYGCPRCGAADRDRLIALYMAQRLRRRRIGAALECVHFGPSPALHRHLSHFRQCRWRTADLALEWVDDRVDLTNLEGYETGSFDVFVCSHVLEHIEDDIRAMEELHRILEPHGWGIVLTPVSRLLPSTLEDPSARSCEERWHRFGQGDHVRIYTASGLTSRLEDVGFEVRFETPANWSPYTLEQSGLSSTSGLYVVEKKTETTTRTVTPALQPSGARNGITADPP